MTRKKIWIVYGWTKHAAECFMYLSIAHPRFTQPSMETGTNRDIRDARPLIDPIQLPAPIKTFHPSSRRREDKQLKKLWRDRTGENVLITERAILVSLPVNAIDHYRYLIEIS